MGIKPGGPISNNGRDDDSRIMEYGEMFKRRGKGEQHSLSRTLAEMPDPVRSKRVYAEACRRIGE